MEPLTGFFILEGLIFDVIGAIIIVRGLKQINPYDLKRVKELQSIFINSQGEVMNLGAKIRKLRRINLASDEDFYLLEKALLEKQGDHQTLGKALPTQQRSLVSVAQHEYSLIEAIKGLPFLIGGFSLQAVGVVIQLFN